MKTLIVGLLLCLCALCGVAIAAGADVSVAGVEPAYVEGASPGLLPALPALPEVNVAPAKRADGPQADTVNMNRPFPVCVLEALEVASFRSRPRISCSGAPPATVDRHPLLEFGT